MAEKWETTFTILNATDLKIADKNGTSDPYVLCSKNGEKYSFKTNTIPKNLNPVWEENNVWQLPTKGEDSIKLQVWDRDLLSKDDFLGEVAIKGLALEEGEHSFQLQPRNDKDTDIKGCLTVNIQKSELVYEKLTGNEIEKKLLIPLLKGNVDFLRSNAHADWNKVVSDSDLANTAKELKETYGLLEGTKVGFNTEIKFVDGLKIKSKEKSFIFEKDVVPVTYCEVNGSLYYAKVGSICLGKAI